MDQVKDLTLDADEGVEAKINAALAGVKQQLAQREQQLVQTARIAQEQAAAARKAQMERDQAVVYATSTEHAAVTNKLAENEALTASLQAKYAAAIETANGQIAGEVTKQLT